MKMLIRIVIVALLIAAVGPVAAAQNTSASSTPGAVTISPATKVDGGTLTLTGNNSNATAIASLTLNFAPRMVNAAFLGVALSPTDATLQSQLKLDEGVGLVVTSVDEQSPAEVAGLKQHDVIYKFADQIAINPEQLEVLIRMHKPGDSVELTVIRQSQPIKLTAKLVEKEVPELSWVTGPGHSGGRYTLSPAVPGTIRIEGATDNPKDDSSKPQR